VIGIKLTGKKGKVVAAFMVGPDDEIVAVSSGGVTIRMAVRDISSQGRDATGVRVMSLDDGQTVASVAPILASDDEECASLVAFTTDGLTAQATVRVGEAQATARATRAP
jgi:hypothetical protein